MSTFVFGRRRVSDYERAVGFKVEISLPQQTWLSQFEWDCRLHSIQQSPPLSSVSFPIQQWCLCERCRSYSPLPQHRNHRLGKSIQRTPYLGRHAFHLVSQTHAKQDFTHPALSAKKEDFRTTMRGGGGRRVADVDQQQGRHHAVHSSNTTNNLASSRQGQETRSLPQGMRTIEPRIKSHLGTAARETGLRIAIPSESGTEMNIASGTRETEGERKIKGNVDPWIPDTGQVSTTFVVNSPESIATPLARTSAFDARYNASPEVSTGRRRRASTIGPRNTDSSGINRRQGSTGFEGNSSSVAGSTTAIQLSPTTPTGPSFAGFAGRVTLRDLTRVDERPSTVQQYLASSHPSSNRLSRQPSYNLRMSRNSPPEDALAIPLSEEASNQPYLELSHPLTSSSSSTIPFPPSRTPSRNQLVRSRHSYADINALSDPSPSSDGHLTFQPQDYDDRNLLPLSISRSTTPSVTPYATPYGSEAESEEGNGSDRRKRDRKRSDHVGYGLGMGMGMGRGGLWGGGMKGFDHDLSPRGSISGEGIEGRRMGRDNEGYSPSGGWFWGWTTSQQHQHQQPQPQSSLSKGFSSVKEVLRHDSFATNSTTSSGSSPSHSRYDFFSYGRDRDGKRGSGSTVNDEGPILIAPSSLMDRKMSGNGTLTGAKKGVNGKARNSRGVRYFGNWLKRTLGLDMVGVGGDSVTSARERKGGNSRLRMYRMTGGSERSTDRDEGALHLNYGKSRRGMGKRRTSGVPGKGSSMGGDRKGGNVLKRIAVALPDSLWTMVSGLFSYRPSRCILDGCFKTHPLIFCRHNRSSRQSALSHSPLPSPSASNTYSTQTRLLSPGDPTANLRLQLTGLSSHHPVTK